jgi:UDP-N-acetyl-D-mannosaminuronic acid transferase (WecB/TagA/CpsF family)
VDAVHVSDVVAAMENWIAKRSACHYIAVTGMHGVTEAQHATDFKAILNWADLVVPDGMPLVWLGRLHGYQLRRRVYGPELMLAFCEATAVRVTGISSTAGRLACRNDWPSGWRRVSPGSVSWGLTRRRSVH